MLTCRWHNVPAERWSDANWCVMMSVSVYSEYQCVSYYTCLSSQGGESVLMRAARGGKTEVVMKLIEAGANLNLQDKVQRLSLWVSSISVL